MKPVKPPKRRLLPPSIFLPVMLFVVFDTVALGLNFWISAQLADSAIAINLAGRQRMLSQRMAKSLLMLQVAGNEAEKEASFAELSTTVGMFDQTLTGFLTGGTTTGGDGSPLYLPAVTEENSRLVTAAAAELWSILYHQLQPVLESGSHAPANMVYQAMQLYLSHNQHLLELMNDLTSTLQQNATQNTWFLRILQACLLVLALLNFGLVCLRLLGEVKKSQSNLHALQNIINSIETGILLFDKNQQLRSANKAASLLFGYTEQALAGKQLQQLFFSDQNRTLGIRKDNSTFVAKLNSQTLYEYHDEIHLCTVVDVSENERKEQELMHLAFHAPLTGLPNRALLMERLQQELLHAKRDSSFLAVLFLDLDGFKDVNDQLGHEAGDELLQAVGQRFRGCCREVDTVARLGGDEFVFVLTALHSATTAKLIANNILESINRAFLLRDETIKIGASIGIALYPDDHSEAALLIKHADQAMYLAKQQGKNRIVFASENRT